MMKPSPSVPDTPEKPAVAVRSRGAAEVTPAAVDLDDLNSPHTLAVLSVPPGATVLDVGCGPGVVARALAARGCRVWGVEVDARKAALARAHCVEVVEADVESMTLPSALDGMRFDAILCLDVLEHLREPAVVLAGLKALLAPGGSILISVPNVTHGALRLELLKGRFGYRSSGLLDRGHLRFFTADALQEMVRQAGLRAETTLRVVKRLDQTEFDVDLESVPAELRQELETDPDALTYQFFVVATPALEGQLEIEGISLAQRLRARVDQITAELGKAGGYARHLEAELKARDQHLQHAASESAHVLEVTAELGRATAYSRRLEEELAAKAGALEARGTELARLTAELEKVGAYSRRLEAELAGTESRAGQLDRAVAGLRRDLAASGARVTEQEQVAADLRRIVDDNTAYVRHLERELQRRVGDIAIRDDEMSVLRAHVEKTERAIVDRESQLAQRQSAADRLGHLLDARNLHVAEIEASVRRLEGELQARAADIATSERAMAGARGALAEQQALAAHLSWVVQQPRHRLADASADALVSGAPWLHRVLRPLVVSLLGRWSRPAPPR